MSYYNWSFYIFGNDKRNHWWRRYGDYQYIHVVRQFGAIVDGKVYFNIYLGVVQFNEPKTFKQVKSIWKENIKWHYYRTDRRMFYRARTLRNGKIYNGDSFKAGVLIIKRQPRIKYWIAGIMN